MKVFKFGGASVKDAKTVKNLAHIITKEQVECPNPLVIVVSAMDKTTNILELFCNYIKNKQLILAKETLDSIIGFHTKIIEGLNLSDASITPLVTPIFNSLKESIDTVFESKEEQYSHIISHGEMLSTLIIHQYLMQMGLNNQWIDAKQYVLTNDRYLFAEVDWAETQHNINTLDFSVCPIVITQGFIGSYNQKKTTVLGREGSDFSGAIFAYCLDAQSLTVWKDVDGVLNADPKKFETTVKFETLSYAEAIELSYYGASIIHPKTIKPLQNKHIPLHVRSFIHPNENGTDIFGEKTTPENTPSIIIKENLLLATLRNKDFSFISEKTLSHIFKLFDNHSVKINLIQNSAITISVVYDEQKLGIDNLKHILNNNYLIRYNKNVTLYTIRNYSETTIQNFITNKSILLTQKSRHTAQFVIKS